MDDESNSLVKREGEGAAAAAAAADSEYAGIPSKRPLPGDDEQHHAPLPAAPSGSGTKAYLAHAASHLSSANNSSRSPSPSSSSPRHTPAAASAAAGSTSKHKLPPHYRGPLPRDDDPEDVAPLPLLHVAPNAIASSSRLYQPTNTPLDRNSWRYTFAGPCTSHLPTSVYRSIPSQPDCIRWDWSDRSAFTKLSREADLVASEKGWRSIRSNVPVREGSWYVEMHVLPPNDGEDGQQHAGASSGKDGPHVRLGWARREAPLNAPVGFDGYSYALRDTTGQCVTLSRPQPYGTSFQTGDVVGMYIHIPPLSSPSPRDMRDPRHIRKRRIPIRYRGQTYFEQLEYAQTKEMEHLMDRSWAGEKLIGGDGRLRLAPSTTPAAGLDPMSDLVEEEDGVGAAGGGGRGGKRNGKGGFSTSSPLPSQSTAPPGTGKSKRQAADEPTATGGRGKGVKGKPGAGPGGKVKVTRQLRPLPTLGSESRIGFYFNGKPLGWAFRDLLDFRPLRPHSADAAGGSLAGSKKKNSKGLDASGTSFVAQVIAAARAAGRDSPFYTVPDLALMERELSSAGIASAEDVPLLTTSASLSAIMKSRENPYDDGGCGYFPMCSSYGGARVKIVSEEGQMRFPLQWSEVERELETADRGRRRQQQREKAQRDAAANGEPSISMATDSEEAQHSSADEDVVPEPWWGHTRPLAERYAEYWQEQWQQDLAEEERARVRAKYIKPVDLDEDDEEEAGGEDGGYGDATMGEAAAPAPAPVPAPAPSKGKKKGSKASTAAANAARRSQTPRQGTPAAASAATSRGPTFYAPSAAAIRKLSGIPTSSSASSSSSSPAHPGYGDVDMEEPASGTSPNASESVATPPISSRALAVSAGGADLGSGSSGTEYDTPPVSQRQAAPMSISALMAGPAPTQGATNGNGNLLDSLAEAALMQRAVEEADAEVQRRRAAEAEGMGMAWGQDDEDEDADADADADADEDETGMEVD